MSGRLPQEIRALHKKQGHNRLLQQDVVQMIADNISKEIGRSLHQFELKALINHLGKLNGNTFRTMPIDEATAQIAKGYLQLMSGSDDVIYDTHEIMKQFIGGGVSASPDRFILNKQCGSQSDTPSSLSSVTKHGHDKAYAMHPTVQGFDNKKKEASNNIDSSLISSAKNKFGDNEEGDPVIGDWVRKGNMISPREKSSYILLDSRYKNRSIGNNIFQWTISPMAKETPGVAGTVAHMKNIIFMQFDKFMIPYSADADNVYRKISLLIEELRFSAVVAHEGRHYHGLFDTEVQSNRILCTPSSQDDCKFRFNEPINLINSITISFGGPLNTLTFLPDNFSVTVTSNGINSTYINFLQNHAVSDGEQIYIVGFTTANPSVDFAAISDITRPTGHTVSVVDNVTLEITSDLSTSTLIVPNRPVECYIATRRIFIPIRFVYIA